LPEIEPRSYEPLPSPKAHYAVSAVTVCHGEAN